MRRNRLSNAIRLSLCLSAFGVAGVVSAQGTTFVAQPPISTTADGARATFAIDLDGDGDPDVLSASFNDDKIAWYENDGTTDPGFSLRTIAINAGGAASVFAIDLDGDGDPDVLSASRDDDKIAWYENDGAADPGFTLRTIAINAGGAQSVYAIDLDGDGDPDVLSASGDDNKIAWYENDGAANPSFSLRTIDTNASDAQSVFAIDLDGDGDPDVLSASRLDNTIAWYQNDGDADPSFSLRIIDSNANAARSVFAIDLDGDGDKDVVSAGGSTIAWYENDGNANPSFTLRIIATNADFAQSVFAIDLDSDGDPDVLSALVDDDTIAWYENQNDDPDFSLRTIATDADVAYSVFAIDLDGDGDQDVLSASENDNTIAWYENDGAVNPGFSLRTIATNAIDAVSVYAIDLDGDGDQDVLSASRFEDKIAWYENDGNADPSFILRTIATNADSARSVFAIDLDGDGDQDVLSASLRDDKIAWYENDGAQNFILRTITTNADGAQSVFAIDLDGDGDQDVLSASRFDTIAWYENDGNADPGFTLRTIPTFGISSRALSVFAIDLDGDGDQDVLSASASSGTIAWYENDGNADPSFSLRTIATNVRNARSVYAIDLDGDGDPDVLSASYYDDTIAWYENDGSADPDFRLRTIATNVDGATSVFAIDLDGDGDPDVLSASRNDDTIAWYENQSVDPGFSLRTIATNADAAVSVFAIDLDGDGDQDVLSASRNDHTIAWYENDGAANPGFSLRTIATNAINAYSVYAIDLDGDGDQDVLSASSFEDKIAWYENDGAQNFSLRTITTSANEARSVFAIDLDGDGDQDVLSASLRDDKIAWYENDGTQNFSLRTIDTNADGALSVFAIDLDGDGDQDVLSASSFDTIAWYENDGNADPGFTLRSIPTFVGIASRASSVFAIDLDGDGDQDVLSTLAASRGTIAWYENDGNADPSFTTRIIATNVPNPRSAYAIDLDGDGDQDVLAASAYDDTIAWYENDGSADPDFRLRTIATNVDGATSVFAIDLDGDGDPDVLSASRNDDTIAWYENQRGAVTPPVNVTVSETSGSEADQTAITVSATADAAVNGDQTVDVTVSGTGITAGDFMLSNTTITIPNGLTTGQVTFTVVDDDIFEGPETATLTISNPSAGMVMGTNISEDIAIADNEAAPSVTLASFDMAMFSENGGTTTLTITTSNPSTTESCFTVSFGGTAAEGVDFTSADDDGANPGTQVCVAGDSTSTTGSIVLTGVDDGVFEGDETLTATVDGQIANTIIADNEVAPTVESLIFNPASFDEEGGTSVLTLTQSGIASSEQCFTVTFTGSATEGIDFSAEDDSTDAGTQICVAPGDTTGDIIVTGISDALFEGDETVTASSGGQSDSADIIDDEAAPTVQSLVFNPAAFNEEGGTSVLTLIQNGTAAAEQCFTVTFTGTATEGVDYTVTDDSADAGTQVCVAPGDTTGDITVTGLSDAVFEGDETVIASSGAASVTAALVDDEVEPTVTALAFAPVEFAENGGTTTLALTQSVAATTEQCFTVAYTGSATLDTDYSSTDDDTATGVQICVAPNDTTGTVVLTGIDDALFEGDETVTASSGGQTTEASITDDEAAPAVESLVFNPTSFSEEGGISVLTLTQSGIAAAEQCVTVTFTGSAIEGVDYTVTDDSADTGTQVCVALGDTTGDMTVTGVSDIVLEGTEIITASSGGQTAEARITDANEPLVIPTLNAWGLGILAGLMAWLGFRRRP